MNEYIEVTFRKANGQRLAVARQVAGGIEFDEPDPIERTVGFQIAPRGDATRQRMRRISQVKDWGGQFKLNVSVEAGNLMLRGVDAESLPEGRYALTVQVEDATTRQATRSVSIDHDGHADLDVAVGFDGRDVDVDLRGCDTAIRRVIDASTIDNQSADAWLSSSEPRAVRRACLLNLLASLRVRPTPSADLLDLVHSVFHVFNDRAYLKVDRAMLPRITALCQDEAQPFYAEGKPTAPIHGRLLEAMPEPVDVKARFGGLLSFRGEQKGKGPSLQMVIAVPPVDLPHTYADFDLDMGNPLQDLAGFVVHMGELLGGKQTNHLDLRKRLAGTNAGGFLYYRVSA